jgi:hypothetical protein
VRDARIRELVEADWRQRCVHGEDDLVTQARMLKLVRQKLVSFHYICTVSFAGLFLGPFTSIFDHL